MRGGKFVAPGSVLFYPRANEPAKGEWFTPGSRLYKGERLAAAARRVGREELGLEVDLTGKLGVYSHFWDTSAVPGVGSRHTVNVVFRGTPAADEFEVTLDEQHDDYRFVSTPEPGLHEYMKRYLADAGYGD
ncbi:MAG: NUDIX domain-containing protein [Halobacteriales archaeon]|nr:NUDIX domain-containing protein [Halobacteriales archaeon]